MSAGMMRIAAAVATVVVMLPAATVVAGPGTGGSGGGTGGSGTAGGGTITATVTYTSGGKTGAASGCTWKKLEGELGVPNLGGPRFPYLDEEGFTWNLWTKTCGEHEEAYVLRETEPTDLLPQLLETLRERRLPQPEPEFLALDPEHEWAYVTVPLDFRVNDETWAPVSVTASIGPVWATVTAVPELLTFDPGDPGGDGPVSCAGQAPTAGYVPEIPGECSYTYRNASSTSPYDGYHFLTTMTVDWAISWTSSTGAGGVLDSYTTSATSELAVAEVKGLVTCTGSRAEQGGC